MRNKKHPENRVDLLAPRVLLVVVLGLGCQQQASTPIGEDGGGALLLPAGAEAAARVMTRDLVAGHVSRLAADEMEGRATASQGELRARGYLVDALASLGLEPAFAGDWEQTFNLLGATAAAPDSWVFSGPAGSEELRFWDEFIATSGIQVEEARIDEAELVFVGYGIQAPEYDWDDYKGVDLEGKVLLMLNNDPEWDDSLFAGNRRLYYGRWDYKYESAGRQGAAGAIIIHTTPSAGYGWNVVQSSWTGTQYSLPAQDEPHTQIEAWITEDSARRLARLAGHDLDELTSAARSGEFKPVPLGLTTSLALEVTLSQAETANAGGLLHGSDPALKNEVVVYTAHYDHLGIGEPDDAGDAIYNGALDNASGCAQVLAVAAAFRALPKPPRRSILFLFVAAEEQGLLGSQYYAQNPSFPPGRIAANVNLDGANIWGLTRDLAYIGYGKSTLDRVVEAAAARQGRTVKPDQFPDRGFFYRSDQFNFAKIGVPAIYLDTGTEFIGRPEGWGKEQLEAWEATHYHQPSDELVDSWAFDGFLEDARLVFETGLSIAELDVMPSWYAGDEFEGARKEALAALE